MDMKLFVFTVLACFSLSQQVPTRFLREKNKESGRLHGGRNANEREFPWMVYLEIDEGDNTYICGGSIISNNYVLTAAHCVCSNATKKTYASLSDIRGKIGVVDIRKGKSIEFNKVIVHKGFDEDVNADIALLKFKNPLTKRNKNISKICLANKGATFANKQPVIQMGWGQMEKANDSDAIILQTTNDGYLLNNGSCKKEMKTYYDPGQLCVSTLKGPKLCEGDSGSPLVVKKGRNDLAIGVASFVYSEECDVNDGSSIFTDISFYADWIKQNTNDSDICWN